MVHYEPFTPFPASARADHAIKIPLIPVVAGLAAVAAPAIVTAPILAVLGFGAAGPVAGSAAAIAQGVIGNVVAGSPFAIAQSAAMGGYGAAIVNGVVQGGGLLLTGISSAECLMSGCGRDEI